MPARKRTRPAKTIAEVPSDERPRERLLKNGAQSLSDAELLAVVLKNGLPWPAPSTSPASFWPRPTASPASRVASALTLRRNGVGDVQLAALLAAVELACRMAEARMPDRQILSRPTAMARYVSLRYGSRDQEVMGAIFVDTRNRLLGEREIFRGTLNRAAVEPREILKEGLIRGAAGVVLFHTHPSGDPSPSAEDILFTRRMAEAGEVVGVRLVDHLIVTAGDRWVSLKDRGAW